MELDEIKRHFLSGDIRASDALARALPKFRGLAADEVLIWCANELQGYSGGLEFYQNTKHELPDYRVVSGKLRLLSSDGTFHDIQHQLAQRNQYFLSAPVAWLEDFYGLPGEQAIADLPELTNLIGRQIGGTVVCECQRSDLQRILEQFHSKFVSLMDEIIQKKLSKGAQSQTWGAVEPVNDGAPSGFAQAPVWMPDAPEKEYEAPPGYVPPDMTPPVEVNSDYQPSEIDSLSGYVHLPPQPEKPQSRFIGGGTAKTPEQRTAGRLRGMESQLSPEQLKQAKKDSEKQAKLAEKGKGPMVDQASGPSGWAPPLPVSAELAKAAGIEPPSNLLDSLTEPTSAPPPPPPPPQPVQQQNPAAWAPPSPQPTAPPPPPPQPVQQQNPAAWAPPAPQAAAPPPPPPQPAAPPNPAAWTPPKSVSPQTAQPHPTWKPPGQAAAPPAPPAPTWTPPGSTAAKPQSSSPPAVNPLQQIIAKMPVLGSDAHLPKIAPEPNPLDPFAPVEDPDALNKQVDQAFRHMQTQDTDAGTTEQDAATPVTLTDVTTTVVQPMTQDDAAQVALPLATPPADSPQASANPNLFENMLKLAAGTNAAVPAFNTAPGGTEPASPSTTSREHTILKPGLSAQAGSGQPRESGSQIPAQPEYPRPATPAPEPIKMAHDPNNQPQPQSSGLPSIPMGSSSQKAQSASGSHAVYGSAIAEADPAPPSQTAAMAESLPSPSTTPAPAAENIQSNSTQPGASTAGLFADMLKLSEFSSLRNQLAPGTTASSDSAEQKPPPTAPDLDNNQVRAILSKSGVNWKANPADVKPKQPSVSPVVSMVIKNKAMQLMTQAYGNKDCIIQTQELTSSDVTVREQMDAALQYLIKMNWVRETEPNVHMLTKEGLKEVEQSLSF